MKNILAKLKIHQVTYLLFFTYLITGYFKNIILIFTIVIIHEMGHIFYLLLFHYPIESIEILPFGGVTKTNKKINTPINQEILIYVGGVFNQILLFLFFAFLSEKSLIKESTYFLFLKYNISILIFNSLPIRPLDGGEIVRLLLEKVYPFKKAQVLANFISLSFLILFFVINIQFNLNNYVIISFLLVKLYGLFKNASFYQNKFLLERLLYTVPYSKIKNEKTKNITLLKKETYHFFKEGEKMISERELLRQTFDIQHYF